VLFADLVGFTPLSESRDPEEVRELLSAYFERTRTVIERYGGIVEKFIGDAVMAVWGTPVAVEGDAERAVRAALDVVAAVSQLGEEIGAPSMQARAGVVTGEVAVTHGAVGEGIAGDSVNTAARVQTAALPGQAWVDETTFRLARAAIDFADTGEHVLKGKSEPMRLWSATRVTSGVGGAQRVDGLEAPLLGRDAELRTIKELFHASAERRSARLVVVSGPPGVGKSRLGWEFEKYVDGLATVVWWHRGRCLAYGEGVAFWALAEIVRQRLGIAEEDPTEVAAAKLAQGLATHVPDAELRGYVGIRLGRLLGVPADGDTGAPLSRDELFAGWRLFLEQLSASGPVVLLVEDAHHADSGLLDFLDHVVDWARDVPVYMLVFGRSELVQSRPGWGVGPNRTVLALDHLDAASMDQLVDALVPGMPEPARAAIAGQSQGIPLFAMETIRALIDRDVVVPVEGVYRLVGDLGDLDVPDSLRGLLAARLDALAPDLRSLVADAAVLGTTFPADALAAVSGRDPAEVRAALSELQRREVFEVSADRLSPQRGAYGFTHAMLRQVAYETLSRRDRKARHLAVAAHLRRAFAGDGDEVIDVIARHYADALATLPNEPDAEDVRAEAIDAYVRGAERALRSGAPGNAATSLALAAELSEQAQRSAAQAGAALLWERAASAAAMDNDVAKVLAHADRAIERYRLLGDERGAARADAIVGRAFVDARRLTEGIERLRKAVSVLEAEPDVDAVTALRWLALTEVLTGGADADRLTQQALVLGQELGVDASLLANLFSDRGVMLNFANRYAEGVAYLRYAAELAERADDGFTIGRAYGNLSSILLITDPAEATRLARKSVEASRRIGSRVRLAIGTENLCIGLLLLGRWNEADELVAAAQRDEALAGALDIDHTQVIIAALRGRVDEAAGVYERLRETADEDPQSQGYFRLGAALLAAARGNAAEALAHARQILELTDAFGIAHELVALSWPLAARAAWELGDAASCAELHRFLDAQPEGRLPPLLRAERDLARARQSETGAPGDLAAAFEPAIAALRAFGSPYHLAWGLLDYAERLTAAGMAGAAGVLFEEARALAEPLGASALLARLDGRPEAPVTAQPSRSST
jgi:class 3 adenylate cyclase/tetratricopeptide (TPR) repeat protein